MSIRPMRIVLLGANGMLGSMMEYVGTTISHDIHSVLKGQFNALTNPVSSLVSHFTTDCCVVNCIGAIPQKGCSNEDMIHLNTVFPLELANLCKSMNIPLIHISTNCVFSGDTSNCIETDVPNAKDVYGKSKANGESPHCVVLRCSIIGPEKTNTSFGLLEWFLHSQETVQGYIDHFWNGLTTLELSKNIYKLIDTQDFTPRIEHLFSSNTLSKYDLLVETGKIFNKHIDILPVERGGKQYTLSSIKQRTNLTIQIQLAELSDILIQYRRYHEHRKDVFLITSVINTGSNFWSYSSIRSVFSPEQRLEQTLKTIDTIRTFAKDSIILHSECSSIDASMEDILKEKVDIYVNCYTDKEVQHACIQSDKKGYGELLQTRHAIQVLQEQNIQFNRLFKISGRYWLTDAFRRDAFSTSHYTFNTILPGSTCHPTVFYSIPYSLLDNFKSVIEQCNTVYKHQIRGYETLLPPLCNPKQLIDGVGVAGYVAVDGSLYSTP